MYIDCIMHAHVHSCMHAFVPAEGQYEEKGVGHIVRSGTGVHTSATGTIYSGQWSGDVLNGKGETPPLRMFVGKAQTTFYPCMHLMSLPFILSLLISLGELHHPTGASYKV